MNINYKENKGKQELQENYCFMNSLPYLVPSRCYGCGCDVYSQVTPDTAAHTYITGCPKCHRSFCD